MAEKKQQKNLAVVPQPSTAIVEAQGAESLIKMAIEKGVDIETMKSLLAMRKELKTEWAKQKFDEAMASFQSKCPTIKKKKNGGRTDAGEVAYKYAELGDIVEQVHELIAENRFSYKFRTAESPQYKLQGVLITCIVNHADGYSEESQIDLPYGQKTRVMSDTQVRAAAVTYGKRYAFCNAFGIMTGDEDIDGQGGYKTITVATDQQMEKLQGIIAKSPVEKLAKESDQIAKSEKYSQEQKDQIMRWIDERVKAVKK